MNKLRVGKFSIPYKTFNAIFVEKYSPEALKELMGKVLIVRAEANFIKSTIDYEGYSELFEEVPEGGCATEYKPLFIHMSDDTLKFGGVEKL